MPWCHSMVKVVLSKKEYSIVAAIHKIKKRIVKVKLESRISSLRRGKAWRYNGVV